jgi:Lrp/AsnC family transcriptional regulator, leucine-responsive regulatory protein
MSDSPSNDRIGSGERAGRSAVELDPVHRRMLEVLREDGRISVAALADQVGISRANAYGRLEWLRAREVVQGFTARVDSRRTGLGITALILASVRQPAWPRLREPLAAMPELEYCAITTGPHDLIMLVRVADVETLRDVILNRLQAMPDVQSTQTVFVLDELVHRPFVL